MKKRPSLRPADPTGLKRYVVDFETYYDKEVSSGTLGNRAYVDHPKFSAYLVSMRGLDDDILWVGDPLDPAAPWAEMSYGVWWAHNAKFDRTVWERWVQPRLLAPGGLGPSRWDCSAALCALHGFPRSLAGASEQLLGVTPDKTERAGAKGVDPKAMLMCEPHWTRILGYGLMDVVLAGDIVLALEPITPIEERDAFTITDTGCLNGLWVDQDAAREGVRKLEEAKGDARSRMPWVAMGYKEQSIKGIGAACEAAGIPPPPSTDKSKRETQQWEKANPGGAEMLLQKRRHWGANALKCKIENFIERSKVDGSMDFDMLNYGAHTGRWSGAGGQNLQALTREPVEGVDIRGMLRPPPGHLFAIFDFAQIEARGLAWRVGDHDFLAWCAKGVSPYEAHARVTMGWDAGVLKKEAPQTYALAKARVLALGYNAGWQTFQSMAMTLAGVELTDEEATATVYEYRRTNPKVKGYWEHLDAWIKREADRESMHCTIALPSGRNLHYFDPRRKGRGVMVRHVRGGHHTNTYGGKLCENDIQALCRDLLRDAMVRLSEHGFDVRWTVHDEAVCVVPEATAEEDLKEILEIAQVVPAWAHGLPIEAEGLVSDRYLK